MSILQRPVLYGLCAWVLCGCSSTSIASCPPADDGGGCFVISAPGFTQHALASARALPQLEGVSLDAPRVFQGDDVTAGTRVWVVPLLVDDQMVAASRFVPAGGGQAKLAEVTLLEDPLPELPEDIGGLVVLWANPACRGDPGLACLFPDYEWAVQLQGGNYRLFTGEEVDSLPSQAALST
jgi:hypothetical protein